MSYFDKQQQLFDLLGQLARRRFTLAEQYFQPLALNHTEARMLQLLAAAPAGLAQDQLSAGFVIDRSNVGRALKQLEQRALLQRQPGERDKRTYHVVLTAAGQQLAARLLQQRELLIAEYFQNMDADEISVVYGLLKKLQPTPAVAKLV